MNENIHLELITKNIYKTFGNLDNIDSPKLFSFFKIDYFAENKGEAFAKAFAKYLVNESLALIQAIKITSLKNDLTTELQYFYSNKNIGETDYLLQFIDTWFYDCGTLENKLLINKIEALNKTLVEKNNYKSLSKILEPYEKNRKVSEIAQNCNMSDKQLSNIKNNETNPKLDTLIKIICGYKVSNVDAKAIFSFYGIKNPEHYITSIKSLSMKKCKNTYRITMLFLLILECNVRDIYEINDTLIHFNLKPIKLD